MLNFELMRDKGILIVTPAEPLEKADFERLSETVDPLILQNGTLCGLMILVKSFPGWENLAALMAHFKFVLDHQLKIQRVAAVTDSDIMKVLPRIVEHLAHPEVRQFAYNEKGQALAWLENAN
ncbi:MAG: STAS/SEC14 domain-containing protein [Nitrosospira sp.]